MISEYVSSSVSPAQAALGDIIVSDPSANALFVQSNCASPPCAAPTLLFSGTPYVTPEGVAMDSSGNIIVADGSGKVFRQSPSGGSPTLLYSGSPYMSPAGVAIDSSGNIIVADLGAKTIFRQSNCASPPCAAPTPISSTGYHFPFGVAIDPLGNIIVADGSGTMFRQNPAGGAPTPISSAGYITPQGVAIGFASNIIVTDYGVRAIFLQSNCASPPCAAPTPISSVGYVTPEGVTIDSSGNFIVVDQGGTVGPPAILRQNPSGGAPATLFSGTPYVSPEFDVVLKPLKTTGGCEMAITKTITLNQVQSGGTATVTLTLTPMSSADCNGNDPVYIYFIDSMPTGLVAFQPVSVTGAYGMNCDVTYGGGIVSCGIYTPTLIPYPTQSETVTFNVQVTAPAGSTITNCALAYVQSSTVPGGTVPNVGCATLTVVGGAKGCDLMISKAMNVSTDGSTVTINLHISTASGDICWGDSPIAVNDTMPSGLTALSAGGAGWTCDLAVICHPTAVPSSHTITITAKVTGTGRIENCAHVIYEQDMNQSNNVSCGSVNVAPPSGCDLKMTKTFSPISGYPTLQLVTLTIVNVGQTKCGESTTYTTIVTDNLPPGMMENGNVDCVIGSSGWNCGISGNGNWYCQVSNSGSVVTCNPINPTDSFSAIPLNTPFTITFPVVVTGNPGSTLKNCATVSDPNDINPANNQSCATFAIPAITTSSTTPTSTAGCVDLSTGTNADYQADAPGTMDSTWKVTNPSGNIVPIYSVTPWFTSSGNFWAGSPGTNSDPSNYVGNKANWVTTNQASGYPDPNHLALVGMYHYTRTFTVSSPSVLTINAFSADNVGIIYISPYSSSGNPTLQTANYPSNVFSYTSLYGPASVSLTPGTYTLAADVNNVDAVVGLIVVASVCPQASSPTCIIATAAYGSEMAAPVQFLRNFRDNEVQKTRLGSAFLQAFNGWYYSWAPSVAQRIAQDENYKAATRAIIAPLIGSLFVGNAMFSILAPVSPELAVVSAGLLASALIGLAYLTPICAISWKLSKRRIAKRTIYRLAIAAAALTFIATLTTGTSDIAANLTALTVVGTLLLAPALVLRKITSYFIQET